MKQVLQHVRSGRLEVADVPEPHCRTGGVVVRNAASLISAGTERTVIEFAGKSMIGKARERPDLVRQVMDKIRKDGLVPTFQTVISRLDQPIALGYSSAGTVTEVGAGAEEFSVGDRVACAGMGYASHAHSIFVPRNLGVRIPDEVSFEDAAYVTLGAIALQGVRIADPRIGEAVAVIGLGLLGQLTVQILKAAGCRVLGIDVDPSRLALAEELGADAVVARSDAVSASVAGFTEGVGCDAVIITAASDSSDPIELGGEISRDRGRIAVVGAVKMDVPRKLFYEKELELRLSRSYGPGRYDPRYEEQGQDYPIGYVRWTERRNMQEFLRLVAAGHVTPSRLTSHRFPIERAGDAYAVVLGETKEPFLGILLQYPERPSDARVRTIQLRAPRLNEGSIGIGFIGAGNFARAVLLPRFAAEKGVELVTMATATGVSARTAGERFGFRHATTDAEELLRDERVHAVVIATRHGSHAGLAARALRSGKAVFVEKPLSISEEGLEEVLAAQSETGGLLTVGFNRRFSPLAGLLKSAFEGIHPLAVQYRVNAGPLPPESWLNDPEQGGGRIIGEVCHFVDLVEYLTDDEPVEVFAHSLGGAAGASHDTVSISLRFRRGSVASIGYFATGDRAFAKERIEVFGGGGVGVLDDFRSVLVSRGGRRRRTSRLSQQKGYAEEVAAFLAAVRGESDAPIALASLERTTRATFAVEQSLRTGLPVQIT